MLFDWFSTIAVECDAPAYPIVQACRKVGFCSPEDVRWCRVSRTHQKPHRQNSWLGFEFWMSFFKQRKPRSPACVCGQVLPKLECYTFTFISGVKHSLLLGQCNRCQSISWREALALPIR